VAAAPPEPKTEQERREFLDATLRALEQGGDPALIEAQLAIYGFSLDDLEGL